MAAVTCSAVAFFGEHGKRRSAACSGGDGRTQRDHWRSAPLQLEARRTGFAQHGVEVELEVLGVFGKLAAKIGDVMVAPSLSNGTWGKGRGMAQPTTVHRRACGMLQRGAEAALHAMGAR